MSALAARLQADLTAARKAGDRARTLVLGGVVADVRNRDIELGRAPSDDEIIEVIRRGIKRRREAAEAFATAARPELAAIERAELAILEDYLPAAPSSDELRAAVRAAIAEGATTHGAVMGRVMPRFKGRVDGGILTAIVTDELAAG